MSRSMNCKFSPQVHLRALFALLISVLISSSIASSQDFAVSGLLEVKISDGLDFSHSRTEYVIRDSRGRKFRLSFARSPGDLLTGQRATIRGRKLNAGKIRVSASARSLAIMSDGPAGVSGVKTVAVLRIQSTTSVSPTTLAQLAAEVAAVDLRAREHSFNLLSVSSDKDNDGTADVYTVFVNQSSAGLTEFDAFNLCYQAKANAGVSGYSHFVCILPPDMTYNWYGQAYIGGVDMVINGNYASGYPNGLEHEMGHNWGRHHSNTAGVEYGDSTCIMGGNAGTANRHFNGPQKLGLGWLSAVDSIGGTYALQPVEESSGTRLIKIRDQVAGQDLYISTRARVGNYSSGPINPGTTQVHEWAGASNKTTLLATLSTGQSYSQNSITITQSAYAGTTATVIITGDCVRDTPSVSIDPVIYNTTSLSPYSFIATIQNRDTNCAATTFSLGASSANPALTAGVGSASMTLSSGQSGTVTLDAAPNGNLGVGTHLLTLSVSDSNHTTASANAQYAYSLATPTNTPIPATATPSDTPLPPTATPISTAVPPTLSPELTPTTAPTRTPKPKDNKPPRVKVRDQSTKLRASIPLTYTISDDSNETSETVRISRHSRVVLKYRNSFAAIPANQSRTVVINTQKLARGSYSICVTASDQAQNSASDCARLLLR